jgi:hypothetical protein
MIGVSYYKNEFGFLKVNFVVKIVASLYRFKTNNVQQNMFYSIENILAREFSAIKTTLCGKLICFLLLNAAVLNLWCAHFMCATLDCNTVIFKALQLCF